MNNYKKRNIRNARKEISNDKAGEKEFKLLADLVKELEWEIAIPSGGGDEDDKMVHGMIIGEKSYVDYILKHLE
jgi:hypothetical protein